MSTIEILTFRLTKEEAKFNAYIEYISNGDKFIIDESISVDPFGKAHVRESTLWYIDKIVELFTLEGVQMMNFMGIVSGHYPLKELPVWVKSVTYQANPQTQLDWLYHDIENVPKVVTLVGANAAIDRLLTPLIQLIQHKDNVPDLDPPTMKFHDPNTDQLIPHPQGA